MMFQTAVLGILVAFLQIPTAEQKDPCAGTSAGTDAWDVSICVDQPGSSSPGTLPSSDAGQTPQVIYSYIPACERGGGITGNDFFGCGGASTCGDEGQAFLVYATYADGSVDSLGVQCIEPSEVPEAAAAPPQVTPGMVAAAFRRVPLPDSDLALAPPGGKTLVGLETVLWTGAEPFTEGLTLLGQRVELEIQPSSFAWSHGDGTGQETTGPGVPYTEGRPMSDYVSHAYTRISDAFALSVDTTWSARFRVGDGPWRDVGETVTIDGPSVQLEVVEAEPNLVGS